MYIYIYTHKYASYVTGLETLLRNNFLFAESAGHILKALGEHFSGSNIPRSSSSAISKKPVCKQPGWVRDSFTETAPQPASNNTFKHWMCPVSASSADA